MKDNLVVYLQDENTITHTDWKYPHTTILLPFFCNTVTQMTSAGCLWVCSQFNQPVSGYWVVGVLHLLSILAGNTDSWWGKAWGKLFGVFIKRLKGTLGRIRQDFQRIGWLINAGLLGPAFDWQKGNAGCQGEQHIYEQMHVHTSGLQCLWCDKTCCDVSGALFIW